MKKYIKIILVIASILITIWFINSRIVSKRNFDIMVMMKHSEILEACMNKSKSEIDGNQYIIPEDVSLYFMKYGDNLCDDTSLKSKIENDTKESLREVWLFVL